MEGLANCKEKPENGSNECLKLGDHAVRRLTLQFLQHLQSLSRINTLYVLEDVKQFEGSALQQVCLTAPALSLMFATFRNQTIQALDIELLARTCAEVVALDVKRNDVRTEAFSRVELCPKATKKTGYGERQLNKWEKRRSKRI